MSNVALSASGLNDRLRSWSFASTNASTALRVSDFEFRVSGTTGRFTGRNAQKERSSSVIPSPLPISAGSGRAVFAPAAIHFASTSISRADTFTCPGGISPALIRCSSLLASGLPGSIAAPDSPPLTISRTNRRSSFPFGSSSAP